MQFGASGGDMAKGAEMMAKGKADLPGMDAVQAWYGSVKGLGLWSTVGEAFATMLIGVALFKWGIIQGLRSPRFYLALTLAGYSVGLALRVWALQGLEDPVMGPSPSEFGRLIMTLGHIGLINLVWKFRFGARLLAPFRAAGRTAFTLYVMQSVVGIWILWAPWGPLTRFNFGSAEFWQRLFWSWSCRCCSPICGSAGLTAVHWKCSGDGLSNWAADEVSLIGRRPLPILPVAQRLAGLAAATNGIDHPAPSLMILERGALMHDKPAHPHH